MYLYVCKVFYQWHFSANSQSRLLEAKKPLSGPDCTQHPSCQDGDTSYSAAYSLLQRNYCQISSKATASRAYNSRSKGRGQSGVDTSEHAGTGPLLTLRSCQPDPCIGLQGAMATGRWEKRYTDISGYYFLILQCWWWNVAINPICETQRSSLDPYRHLSTSLPI